MDVHEFVDAADIDPVYFQKTYYLARSDETKKAYTLLLKAMDESERSGSPRW